jgi:hypothetical protein
MESLIVVVASSWISLVIVLCSCCPYNLICNRVFIMQFGLCQTIG